MTKFGVAPADFWTMRPRDFWWLIETLDPPQGGSSLSEADKRAISQALKGNGKGDFW